MDRQARILDELNELFRDIFAQPYISLTLQTTAAEVAGWDSMKHIEITIAVEEKYGVRLRAREVDSLHSVGDLVALIERKTT